MTLNWDAIRAATVMERAKAIKNAVFFVFDAKNAVLGCIYDAKVVPNDAKAVQYDAKRVQNDAKLRPKEAIVRRFDTGLE